ncbi:MAG: hypothetical protein JWO43_592 [Candidatus Adlerbacteria bacterium]|nr:hypothetical protein [Candidatus Adlerbacteria bacterium]
MISLILGVVLGVVSVFFVLQNVAPVTVSFLSWHIDGSLALVLFITLAAGALTSVLVLLPSVIRDTWRYAALRDEKKRVDEENAALRNALATVMPNAGANQTIVVERTETTVEPQY